MPSLLLGKLLNGVAQHSAGHSRGMGIQEGSKDGKLTLPDLAQHPTAGLVREVTWVPQQGFAQLEGVCKIALPNESLGRQHGDALFPEARRGGESFQNPSVALKQPDAEDVRRAGVHEIPVVDPPRIG